MGGCKRRLWVRSKDGEGQTLEGLPTRDTGESKQGLDTLTAPLTSCPLRNPKSPESGLQGRGLALMMSLWELINGALCWWPGLDCVPLLAEVLVQ